MNNFYNNFSEYKLELNGVRLPQFEISTQDKIDAGASADATNFEFLESLCRTNFHRLPVLSAENLLIYTNRLNQELETLKELEFVDYILLVWDILNYCKKNQIPVGLGRGSAAGSLVLYLIGVTQVDPIKYGLYFERFISKTRAKKRVVDGVTYLDGKLMCDIDIDICYYNRPTVLKYLEQKFQGRTSKILTLNTLQGKILIKECGKIVKSYSEDTMKEVADLIPKTFGKVEDIETARKEVEDFNKWCEDNEDVYTIAIKLRNLIKNKSVHPSAMLISYHPLIESCPIEASSSKETVCSYDMEWATLTNLKLDLLGLRAVSVIDDVCKMAGIQIKDIDYNDPFIYQQLQDLKHAHGIFQIEATTAYSALRKIKPKNLDELSGVMAVARPGAMQFIEQYATYTNTGVVQSVHPFFTKILDTTGSLCLYQEQMMQMAHSIGFTLEEAETLRRIVGKKKTEEMAEWQEKVAKKCEERGLDKSIGDILWKILDASKDYSFNRSHSICYAALAATTTYLKFKYPQFFYLSLLRMTRHEPDPISEITVIEKELRQFNIKLLPPHILLSELDFSIEQNNIRFGLLSIKGISDKTIEKLQKFKSKHSNKFEIFHAAQEASLGIGILSALIQAGALQGFSESRSKIVLEAQLWNILTPKEQKLCMDYAEKFNFDLVAILKSLLTINDEKGKPLLKESRFNTIKKNYEPYKNIYLANKASEVFANWFYEKKLLGYTYDVTLKDIFSEKNPELCYIQDVLKGVNDDTFYIVGTVEKSSHGVSKNGNKYYKMIISDETSSITVLMFDTKRFKNIEECLKLNGMLPKEENIVIVKGTKKDDCLFAQLVAIQDTKIYTRLKDLKHDEEKKQKKELTEPEASSKI